MTEFSDNSLTWHHLPKFPDNSLTWRNIFPCNICTLLPAGNIVNYQWEMPDGFSTTIAASLHLKLYGIETASALPNTAATVAGFVWRATKT